MSIFDASEKYSAEGMPLVILAGKEYGSGSSRDWAAKGPLLLGVRAVIAESYERIHRSNLVGMGILPLQFLRRRERRIARADRRRSFRDHRHPRPGRALRRRKRVKVRARQGEDDIEFEALVRIDTPQEALYYANGGILQYVLRQLLATKREAVGA